MLIEPTQDCKLLGAVRAVTGLEDAVLIVHGRPGCHSGMLALQAFTSSHRRINVVYSGLRSEDMIYGGEKRLLNAILNTYKIMKPRLIVIAVTSSTGIMGDDIEGVVQEVKERHGVDVPIFVVNACGYSGPESLGYEEVMAKLAELVCRAEDKVRDSANIVGFHPDEPHWMGDLQEIRDVLSRCGVKINLVLSWCSVDDIRKAARAELNICLGGDGISFCKRLQEEHDVPYVIVPYPYGRTGLVKFLESISHELSIDVDWKYIEKLEKQVEDVLSNYFTYVDSVYGSLSAVLVGDSSRVFYLADVLKDELSMTIGLVCARQSTEQARAEAERFRFTEVLISPDRHVLRERVLELDPDVVYGSTFERDLAILTDAALVRVFFPTVDEVCLTGSTLVGPRGMLTLLEKTINSLMKCQERAEALAYGGHLIKERLWYVKHDDEHSQD